MKNQIYKIINIAPNFESIEAKECAERELMSALINSLLLKSENT